MSTDPGSFAVHFPCRCVDCALRHGDQAEDSESAELLALRREVAELKAKLADAAHHFWEEELAEYVRTVEAAGFDIRDTPGDWAPSEDPWGRRAGRSMVAALFEVKTLTEQRNRAVEHSTEMESLRWRAEHERDAEVLRLREEVSGLRASLLVTYSERDNAECRAMDLRAHREVIESTACGWVFDAVRAHELIPEAEALEQCALAATMVRERCARLVEDLGWSDVEELHGRHSYNPCTDGNATLKNIAAAIRGTK